MSANIEMDSVIQQLSVLVEAKTFSLEAVAKISELRDFAKRQSEELETLSLRHEELRVEKADAIKCKNIAETENNRLNELVATQNGVIESLKPADYERRIAQAESTAYKFALETVFRPGVVRRTVQGQIATTAGTQQANGSYGGGTFLQPTTTTTVDSDD